MINRLSLLSSSHLGSAYRSFHIAGVKIITQRGIASAISV